VTEQLAMGKREQMMQESQRGEKKHITAFRENGQRKKSSKRGKVPGRKNMERRSLWGGDRGVIQERVGFSRGKGREQTARR